MNEAALAESRRNLEAIYQASGDGLALCEAVFDQMGRLVDYQVLEVNRAHAELTAASREDMLTRLVSTIAPPVDPKWFETADRVLKTGIMENFDVRSPATGRWLNVRVSRVSERRFQQTFVDVSDRRLIEEQRASLLKEMNHRVMNNFNMIAGLLHLQAGQAPSPAKEQLITAELRVHVLAALHALLAYSESDADIDAANFVNELCGYLASTIERPDAVAIVCDAQPLSLPTRIATLLGFIVSELVTNSAKYAYPAPRSGRIDVRLERKEGGWSLVVRDYGQGFDPVEPGAPKGLGMQLVRRFISQIGADLVTTSSGGVAHQIDFRPR